jgi:hypothetical protein
MLWFGVGCVGAPGGMMPAPGGPGPDVHGLHDPEAPFLAGLPSGAEQLARLCARGHGDRVFSGLCDGGAAPGSLVELEQRVGLFDGASPPQFALLANSSSLVARTVTALNPRAIIFTAPSRGPTTQPNDGRTVRDPGFVALGFARGEQLVELVAHDPVERELHFYLVKFHQACNAADQGCTPGDLYTPTVERGWTDVTVYEDTDLANTVFDCLHCHQPGGPGTRKLLRMQERREPWTHWLRNNRNEPGGMALLEDFRRAHDPDEDYAGIPGGLLDTPRSDPLLLEALISNNSVSPQPNEFDGARIEREVFRSSGGQPRDNHPPGRSTTWEALYARAVAGEVIPPPYHDVKVTDARKLADAAEAYRGVVSGALPPEALPDFSGIFLAGAEPALSFRPRPGLDGRGILQHMCQRCHHPALDPSLSRARFDVVRLDELPRAIKDLAIQRLLAAPDAPGLMPPRRFGRLSPDEIRRAIAELMR